MLYLLINQLGWLAFMALLIVVLILYAKINQQIRRLRRDMTELQAEFERHKDSVTTAKSSYAEYINTNQENKFESEAENSTSAVFISEPTEKVRLAPKPPELPKLSESSIPLKSRSTKSPTSTIEPDERSLPIVTSLIHSIKNWFFGGNLVVRVGVLVLLVGVVLLLRLLSDYIEIPIAVKLIGIGIIGLALAALGLALAKKTLRLWHHLARSRLSNCLLNDLFCL